MLLCSSGSVTSGFGQAVAYRSHKRSRPLPFLTFSKHLIVMNIRQKPPCMHFTCNITVLRAGLRSPQAMVRNQVVRVSEGTHCSTRVSHAQPFSSAQLCTHYGSNHVHPPARSCAEHDINEEYACCTHCTRAQHPQHRRGGSHCHRHTQQQCRGEQAPMHSADAS